MKDDLFLANCFGFVRAQPMVIGLPIGGKNNGPAIWRIRPFGIIAAHIGQVFIATRIKIDFLNFVVFIIVPAIAPLRTRGAQFQFCRLLGFGMPGSSCVEANSAFCCKGCSQPQVVLP